MAEVLLYGLLGCLALIWLVHTLFKTAAEAWHKAKLKHIKQVLDLTGERNGIEKEEQERQI